MGRAVAAASLALLGCLVFSLPALAADPPPIPKPDPPPIAKPAPPPPVARPPAPQPVAPPPVAVAPAPVAPAATGPTRAQRRAAAARRARQRAARAARARRAAAEKLAEAHRRERAQTPLAVDTGSGSGSSTSALPYLLAVFTAGLVMLGLALTPTWAVPWSRASRVLEDRRDELGVIGAMSLVATFLFFLLVQGTK